jgi:membrane protein DedA with SNARE-associated domain
LWERTRNYHSFLLALSEAAPVIGTVVPGSTLILAISALATTAGISPWTLLVAAVAGAIAGDGFSFWLGQRYRNRHGCERPGAKHEEIVTANPIGLGGSVD